jgi:antitoxin MazE
LQQNGLNLLGDRPTQQRLYLDSTGRSIFSFPRFADTNVKRDYNVITGVFFMKAELVRIGNFRGIRIPKPLIEQCGLGDTVELRVDHNCLVISPGRRPRQDWAEAFRAAGSAEPDELLLQGTEPNEFDREEWRW